MSFNKKVKEYFKSQGLSNRQVSEIMEGYSETMISKVLNKDDLSTAFLEKMLKYFPLKKADSNCPLFFISLLQFQFLLRKSLVQFRFWKWILLSEYLNNSLIYLLHSILKFQSYPLKNSIGNFVHLFFSQ